jgi:hypothetical protein
MGMTVMGFDGVGEASGHNVVPVTPNMCISPVPPSPLPIPCPITGTSAQLDPGIEKTKLSNKKLLDAKGEVKRGMGNEPGTQKDIPTMTTSGHAWLFPVSAVTVHFERAPIAVTGNPGMDNSP